MNSVFVPGYTHDIFLSYAKVDDQPLGWVSHFAEHLQDYLARCLGRREIFEVWWDRTDLDEAAPLTDDILAAVRSSAILCVVLSPGYARSEWCARERQTFIEAVRDVPQPERRLFLIDTGTLEVENRPPELADYRGFDFFAEDETGRRRTLRPLGDGAEFALYHDRVDDVAFKLSRRLGELKRLVEAASPRSLAPGDAEATAAAGGSITPRMGMGTTVFVAKPSEDVEPERENLFRYLAEHGFRVVPDIPLPLRTRAECEAEIDRLLEQSSLFVQVLGQQRGIRLRDADPSDPRLVQAQYDRASAAGIPVLQWASPHLDTAGITQPELRQLVESPAVMRCSLEEFRVEVRDQAAPHRKKPTNGRPAGQVTGGKPIVFVNSSREDRAAAEQVKNALENLGCLGGIPLELNDPTEIREDLNENILDCDGLVLLYGETSPRWVRQQQRYLNRLPPDRETPLRGLAMVTAPPADKAPIDMGWSEMQLIECTDGFHSERLAPFVASLTRGDAT